MKNTTILLGVLLTLVLKAQRVQGRPYDEKELIYPERVHKTKSRKDLKTEVKDGLHEDVVNFELKTKQAGNLVLDLKKREEEPRRVAVRTYAEDGTPVHKYHDQANCFYSGTVVGQELSDVSVSTCDQQINGIIDIGEKRYKIETQRDAKEGQHEFFELKHEKPADDVFENEALKREFQQKQKRNFATRDRPANWRDLKTEDVNPWKPQPVSSIYMPYMTDDQKKKTRYIELHISVGKKVFQKYDWGLPDSKWLMIKIRNHVGEIDRIYSTVNIRVVLKSVEYQNYNWHTFTRSEDPEQERRGYEGYVRWIKTLDWYKQQSIDLWGFYRANRFGNGEQGRARTFGICKDQPFVVVFNDDYSMAAHEIGHSLGMNHDGDRRKHPQGCQCLGATRCLMDSVPTGKTLFSTCSLQVIKDYFSKTYRETNPYGQTMVINNAGWLLPQCMDNVPEDTFGDPTCGNGIKEGEEECDCGTAEMCAQKNSCCVPDGCTFKEDKSDCDEASGQ